jgi:uncharacterized protein YoxC
MGRTFWLIVVSLLPDSLASGLKIVGQQQQVTVVNANPIRKVVSLLQGMASKIEAEGAKEEELYEKFMCYCKTSGGDLMESITSSTAKVPQVQSDIEASESQLKQTKLDLKSHQEDRIAAKAAMATATTQRESEHSKYVAESGELKSYVSSLSAAIPAIAKGMSGTFLQSETSLAALQKAVASAERATEYDKQYVTSFLSGHASNGYVPKSGEIVGILKEMNADFKKSLAEVEEEEAGQVKLYEELMAAKTKQVETLTTQIEKKSVLVGELGVSIVSMKNDLTETEAALIADKQFMNDLDKSCATKKGEMEERLKTRADEMVAIQDTIKILNDDDALELFKKTLPSPSLLQVKANSAKLRRKALNLVRSLQKEVAFALKPGLDLLAMALSGSSRKIDFSKVIKMIDDMVALLKTEQIDDDSKKEYCEMQLDQSEDKTKELTAKVDDLTSSIEEKEELIKTAIAEIKVLTKSIEKLDHSVTDASFQRKKEHEEYVELISSDNAAKELLNFAKNRLQKFYNPKLYKAPPKKEVSELEQIDAEPGVTAFVQIQEHHLHKDAPEAAPATWDGGYKKKGGESSGVISMIDLLIRDLDKEMTEAEVEEKEAQKDYEEMMNDSSKKRAADTKAIRAKEAAKAEAEEGKVADEATKEAESKELTATKMYAMQLHQECDWLIQNFDLRKASRSEEMDNLQQAKAVLSGADFSLMQSDARASPPRHLRGNSL